MIKPNEASTVPPGTPGAPIAKKPSKMINTSIVVKSGILPYNICETVNTKNTSVKIEPHRWMFANRGTVTSITSSRKILLFLAQVKAVPKVAAADMVRRGCRGHILNMSSYSLWMPFPGLALYSASKAYLRSFSVAFAKEVHEHGIRVTAVCPAGVATDLYGLTPRWQRIGTRLGVLITADSCARRGLRALWRGASSPTGGTACGFPSARCCRCGCCVRSAGSR